MTELNWWTLAAGLIGALLGAGGAALAQLIAAHYTAKRESQRLAFEKDKNSLELAAQSARLFFDSKTRAFLGALELIEDMWDIYYAERAKPQPAGITPEAKEDVRVWEDRWRRIRAEVSFFDESIAPDLWAIQSEMKELMKVLYRRNNDHFLQATQLEEKVDELRRTMRASLEG